MDVNHRFKPQETNLLSLAPAEPNRDEERLPPLQNSPFGVILFLRFFGALLAPGWHGFRASTPWIACWRHESIRASAIFGALAWISRQHANPRAGTAGVPAGVAACQQAEIRASTRVRVPA